MCVCEQVYGHTYFGVCFLADHAAARSMIGYWHDTVVRPSVHLFVTLCIVALRVGV